MGSEEKLGKKKPSRKAKPGGNIKWINIVRNWLHQAVSYMDKGEMLSRLVIEFIELCLVSVLVNYVLQDLVISVVVGFVVVHTWNWVTNCLFWAVIIFAFPNLKNPGAEKTREYLNSMRTRLLRSNSVSGLAVYGSVSRRSWHDRSDVDIRILRRKGVFNLLSVTFITMQERFTALMYKQPIDLYFADTADFLKKMRVDEVPILLIKRDDVLDELYPGNDEQELQPQHFV